MGAGNGAADSRVQVILWEDLAMSGGGGRVLEDSGDHGRMETGVQCHSQSARHQGGKHSGEPECLDGRVRMAHWSAHRNSSIRTWR